jgi:hypothetical protein
MCVTPFHNCICVASFTLPPLYFCNLLHRYAQRQSVNVQRIQHLRTAVAAEEIPDFTGKFIRGLRFCFRRIHVIDGVSPLQACCFAMLKAWGSKSPAFRSPKLSSRSACWKARPNFTTEFLFVNSFDLPCCR